MRGVIARICLGVWLGGMTAMAAQLPPEIMVDRYLLRADRLMEANDPKGALEIMGKIVALQREHGLTLPDEFHFKHARIALSAGKVQDAIDAVNKYLLEAGREGKFYRAALELLDEVEQREQIQTWVGTDKLCAGQPKGTSCWMEVTGRPGCYVWNPNLQPDETVTWTGGCSGGRAQGVGTLKWVYDGGKKTAESTGGLTDGKMHGQWVIREADGDIRYVAYEDGDKVKGSSRRQSQPESTTAGRGPCQVPGYPNPPGGVANLGFSWCPASVGMQVRAFALQAAGAQCAIATGSSSTPEQIEARRREIRAACDWLAALGQGNCQCPPGLGQ